MKRWTYYCRECDERSPHWSLPPVLLTQAAIAHRLLTLAPVDLITLRLTIDDDKDDAIFDWLSAHAAHTLFLASDQNDQQRLPLDFYLTHTEREGDLLWA